jgi:hypothetical protein
MCLRIFEIMSGATGAEFVSNLYWMLLIWTDFAVREGNVFKVQVVDELKDEV